MKRLLPVLIVFAVFLGSAGESFALPECPGSPAFSRNIIKNWTDCFGTQTYDGWGKYVGEWKDGKKHGQGTFTFADGRVLEGIFANGGFTYAQKVTPTETAKKSPEPSSQVQRENERLRQKIARLEKKKNQKPKSQPTPETATSGSGFFVSKTGHVITNQYIVDKCTKVTVIFA